MSEQRNIGSIPGDQTANLVIRMADDRDRETIYRIRHDVYACELGQHSPNGQGRLTDALDAFNEYIVVCESGEITGFVSITPPGRGTYSIDKYFKREQLGFPVDDRLYEVRLLTITHSARRSLPALALMYASFRWVESHGGTRIMAIGRHEVMGMYQRVGLKPCGLSVKSGAVTYDLMQARMMDIHEALVGIRQMLERLETKAEWNIGVAFRAPSPCYHGGTFFHAVGEDFASLDRLNTIINADVLDAWFEPSPKAVAALARHLPALLRTSPPTYCEGLVKTIARVRGVPPECILPGAGSSDLIFAALRHWLGPKSRVLLLDPTYGEYVHVLEALIGCQVERLLLRRSERYQVNLQELEQALERGYDMVVLVNPNSPTGQHVRREQMERVLKRVPAGTRVWVDETYVEYAGAGQSLEKYAVGSQNVIVCKSMSKTYALSGARVAYLCAGTHQLETLRSQTPPWAVSLPAQVAAVHALDDPDYYAAKYAETHALRAKLVELLEPMGWEIVSGVANFILCHLPENGPDAETVIAQCRQQGLYLRNVGSMGTQLGDRVIRIAVKDGQTNTRIAEILRGLKLKA